MTEVRTENYSLIGSGLIAHCEHTLICAGKKSSYTWEQVLKVLYQSAVGGDRVADELKKKYRVP